MPTNQDIKRSFDFQDESEQDFVQEQVERGEIPKDQAQCYYHFLAALNQAQVVNNMSQRALCERLKISIGTMTKYKRAQVHPMNVKSYITEALAKVLGISMNELFHFYRTGSYEAPTVNKDQVCEWLKSEAGQEDLKEALLAASASTVFHSGEGAPEQVIEEPKLDISDEAAAAYGRVLADAFNEHGLELMLSRKEAWKELKETKLVRNTEKKMPGYTDTCQKILARQADLTKEQYVAIVKAFGFCPCHKALEEWVGHDLPEIRLPV